MSSAPTTSAISLDLSEPEFKALEQFAQANGMTTDQAATFAAHQQLQTRYVMPKRTNNVSRFPA